MLLWCIIELKSGLYKPWTSLITEEHIYTIRRKGYCEFYWIFDLFFLHWTSFEKKVTRISMTETWHKASTDPVPGRYRLVSDESRLVSDECRIVSASARNSRITGTGPIPLQYWQVSETVGYPVSVRYRAICASRLKNDSNPTQSRYFPVSERYRCRYCSDTDPIPACLLGYICMFPNTTII